MNNNICSKCKKLSVKLIPLNDNGKGRRTCRDCKKKIKKILSKEEK